MEGATDLSDLLGSGPVQNPTLPQSTTFAPIVTGGSTPFIDPVNTSAPRPTTTSPSLEYQFSKVRSIAKSFMTYFGFFLGALLISLSIPRTMILQYIPNTYTVGGVPSYMGAGILAGVAVAIGYVIGTLFSVLI